MPSLHACALCDYSRQADNAAVLDPACPVCGGMLALADPAPVAATDRLGSLTRERWFERTLLGLIVLPMLAAAGKLGWDAAGPAATAGALLLAGLVAYVVLAPTSPHR